MNRHSLVLRLFFILAIFFWCFYPHDGVCPPRMANTRKSPWMAYLFGGCSPVAAENASNSATQPAELPEPAPLSLDEASQLFPTLKWESNDKYKGLGSIRARKGGTLRSVSSSFPPTLRPLGKNSNTTFLSLLSTLVYETLLSFDSITLGYIPNLANQWAIAPDKMTFFFKIDPRAKWPDGLPVIAEDVVRTWELCVDPGIDDPFNNDYWGKYFRPVALASDVVAIRSKLKNWRAFLSIGASFYIFPSHVLGNITGKEFLTEWQNKMLSGSGPYSFESSKVNEEIILRRRKDWWQQDSPQNRGLYNFERLNYSFISDENLIKERFKKGDLDWYFVNVSREWQQEFIPTMMPKIAKGWIQKSKIFTHQPMGLSGLAFNLRKPPFNDSRVRKAVAYLFNRAKLMNKLFYNEYVFTDSFYPNSPYENPGNPKIRYNPDKAVELLEEAGWLQKNRDYDGWLMKNGERLILSLNFISPSTERVLTVLQEDFRDVGIDLRLKQVTWATDLKEVGQRNFRISYRAYGGLLFPNPESSLHSKFADIPNSGNIYGLKNKRVDELSEEYNLMFDVNDRIKAAREVDKIVCEDHIMAFGWHCPHTRLLYRNKFGQPVYFLGKTGDERDIAALWWYDEEKDKKLSEAMQSDTALPPAPVEVHWWDEYEKSNRTMNPND